MRGLYRPGKMSMKEEGGAERADGRSVCCPARVSGCLWHYLSQYAGMVTVNMAWPRGKRRKDSATICVFCQYHELFCTPTPDASCWNGDELPIVLSSVCCAAVCIQFNSSDFYYYMISRLAAALKLVMGVRSAGDKDDKEHRTTLQDHSTLLTCTTLPTRFQLCTINKRFPEI